MFRLFLVIFTLITYAFLNSANAYFELSTDSSMPKEMNGIQFDSYKNFPQEWHLVTVRYRQDSKEMRLIYANDIAWNAMKSLKPNYPDGAIFGKVGMMGESDPAFPSSITPAGGRRFQLMIKNKSKYKSTDGWGYALFDTGGRVFNKDIKSTTQACAACHRVVPDRDYIFSRKMNLSATSTEVVSPHGNAKESLITFKEIKKSDLPLSVQKKLPLETNRIHEISGEIKKSAFSGTLDEIVPILMLKTKSGTIPAGLVIDELNYSLVIPNPNPAEVCNAAGGALTVYVVFNGKAVRNADVCQ